MAADGSTVADLEEAACPTTPKDGPDLGALRGAGSSSDRPTPVGERPDPGPPMGQLQGRSTLSQSRQHPALPTRRRLRRTWQKPI